MIPVDQLKVGTVYRVQSRNLEVAVYAGKDAFIGIPHKFGFRFLEYESLEVDRRNGTVSPLESLGTLAEDVVLATHLPGRICGNCDQIMVSIEVDPSAYPHWGHAEEAKLCPEPSPCLIHNDRLFKILDAMEGHARSHPTLEEKWECLKGRVAELTAENERLIVAGNDLAMDAMLQAQQLATADATAQRLRTALERVYDAVQYSDSPAGIAAAHFAKAAIRPEE